MRLPSQQGKRQAKRERVWQLPLGKMLFLHLWRWTAATIIEVPKGASNRRFGKTLSGIRNLVEGFFVQTRNHQACQGRTGSCPGNTQLCHAVSLGSATIAELSHGLQRPWSLQVLSTHLAEAHSPARDYQVEI